MTVMMLMMMMMMLMMTHFCVVLIDFLTYGTLLASCRSVWCLVSCNVVASAGRSTWTRRWLASIHRQAPVTAGCTRSAVWSPPTRPNLTPRRRRHAAALWPPSPSATSTSCTPAAARAATTRHWLTAPPWRTPTGSVWADFRSNIGTNRPTRTSQRQHAAVDRSLYRSPTEWCSLLIFLCVRRQLAAECVMFSSCPSVRPSVCPCLWTRYLTNRLCEFHQIYLTCASEDKDERTRFWGQKVKGQGHNETSMVKNHLFKVHLSGEGIMADGSPSEIT